MFNFIKNIGSTELIILAVIVILFFGSRALLGLARTSGKTVKEMKNIKKEFFKAIENDEDQPSKS